MASDSCRQYAMLLDARGRQVTGICILQSQADGTVVGTVVNEFGVKAFDVVYDGRRAQILDLVGPLDHWYIRRVLQRDFAFLLTHLDAGTEVKQGIRSLSSQPDGQLELYNRRYRIRYSFTPMTLEP